MRDDLERLQDMLDAIARIEKYTQQGREAFEQQELIQTWMIYHLQIIGEAARATSTNFKARHSAIPWQNIADFRNIPVHEYFRVDLNIVWDVIQQNLPTLKHEIEAILQEPSP